MWHKWIKEYRAEHSLTQERAATILGVEPRTIQRWEAGTHQPTEAQKTRLRHIVIPSPAHMLGPQLKGLMELSSDFIVLYDRDFRVVAHSLSHKRHCFLQYGRADFEGEDWRKWMPPATEQFVAREGGGRGMIDKGYVSLRSAFYRPAGVMGNALETSGHIDHSVLRVEEGTCHLTITRLSDEPELIAAAKRQAEALTPALVTMLNT